MANEVLKHPVQTARHWKGQAFCSQAVTLRAYEVYKQVYGEQVALITNGCRGGFSVGELIAFLYAYGFPKQEWDRRVQQAFDGMENIG